MPRNRSTRLHAPRGSGGNSSAAGILRGGVTLMGTKWQMPPLSQGEPLRCGGDAPTSQPTLRLELVQAPAEPARAERNTRRDGPFHHSWIRTDQVYNLAIPNRQREPGPWTGKAGVEVMDPPPVRHRDDQTLAFQRSEVVSQIPVGEIEQTEQLAVVATGMFPNGLQNLPPPSRRQPDPIANEEGEEGATCGDDGRSRPGPIASQPPSPHVARGTPPGADAVATAQDGDPWTRCEVHRWDGFVRGG